MSKFTEGFIEGTVSMTVAVAAMYIGTNLGLKVRKKLSDLQESTGNYIEEFEEEVFDDEDADLFND